MSAMPPFPASRPTPARILVDARALQEPASQVSLSALHGRIVLSALRAHGWHRPAPRMIALVDASLPTLDGDNAALFDETSQAPQQTAGEGAWLITLSPMIHDPLWLRSLIRDARVRTIALCSDISILTDPERLRDQVGRAHALAALAWLTAYDCVATLSSDAKGLLGQALGPRGPSAFAISTAPRAAFAESGGAPRPRSDRSGILASGAGDPLGCIETLLRAHARSTTLHAPPVPLIVQEKLTWERRAHLRTVYAQAGGQPLNLVFHACEPTRENLDDALLTVPCGSGDRSLLTALESAAAGTPVIAPDYPALREEIGCETYRFAPDRPDALQALIERVVQERDAWEGLRDEQSAIAREFTESALAHRVLEGIDGASRAPLPLTPRIGYARPQIAVLTPLPPSRSGVADFSAATLAALADHADIHVFTDTVLPRASRAYRSVSPISQAYAMRDQFDATISVLGNSDYHLSIYRYLLERGGAAIAHDARMLHFYVGCLGLKRTLQVARAEGESGADAAAVATWMQDQDALPILFLSEIAAAARPLFVHSRLTADLIGRHYRATPIVLPFAQYREVPAPEKRRRAAGAPVSLVTFGYVGDDKAPDRIIAAVVMLRRWGVDARLTFCGYAEPALRDRLRSLAADLGMGDAVEISDTFVTEDAYRQRMAEADIGIQLRNYKMGGLSGALSDCISAALPTIANAHLAQAMEAPAFVRTIPDTNAPVDIAEAVLGVLQSGEHAHRPLEAARAYASDHSCDRYARLLLQELGFDVERRDAVSCVA